MSRQHFPQCVPGTLGLCFLLSSLPHAPTAFGWRGPLTAAVDVEALLPLLLPQHLVEQQHALLVGALLVAVDREVVVGQQQLALCALHHAILAARPHVQHLQEVLYGPVIRQEPSVHGASGGQEGARETMSPPDQPVV